MTEITKSAYENGMARGTAQGRLMGRLEAYRDMEQYLNSILLRIPRYDSPNYIKQALAHCQSRIAFLSSPRTSSIKDSVEKVKEVADQIRNRNAKE